MTGLLGLIIGVILLVAIVAVFFLTIEKIVSDPLLVAELTYLLSIVALIALSSWLDRLYSVVECLLLWTRPAAAS
jgi:hypothetical protein